MRVRITSTIEAIVTINERMLSITLNASITIIKIIIAASLNISRNIHCSIMKEYDVRVHACELTYSRSLSEGKRKSFG